MLNYFELMEKFILDGIMITTVGAIGKFCSVTVDAWYLDFNKIFFDFILLVQKLKFDVLELN